MCINPDLLPREYVLTQYFDLFLVPHLFLRTRTRLFLWASVEYDPAQNLIAGLNRVGEHSADHHLHVHDVEVVVNDGGHSKGGEAGAQQGDDGVDDAQELSCLQLYRQAHGCTTPGVLMRP